jgi:primosomal protein N' (replication factor Y)
MDAKQQELFSRDLPPWEIDAGHECPAAAVVFSDAPHGPFHYRVPDPLAGSVKAGMRLIVPLGKSDRPVLGYCIAVEIVNTAPSLLKEVQQVLDDQPLCSGPLLKLIHWMARYYLVPLGQVFESVIPAGVRASSGTKMRSLLRPAPEADQPSVTQSLPTKQQQVLQQLIMAGEPLTSDALQKLAQCSNAPIQALRSRGLILVSQERVMEHREPTEAARQRVLPSALSVDQRQAYQAIRQTIESGQHRAILLHGVTGSGKTEVYMQGIETVISYGRQGLILVPEISLTPQTRQRFQDRFGRVAVLHSHMTDAERHFQWRRISQGEADVVIGPRSAVFAPLPNLGLIVIDEEHETSFKQDTIPRYHARDVALHRASLEQIPLVLGSATPSLETWHRARTGQYGLANLPRRIHNRPMPKVEIVDLRESRHETARGSISRPLYEAMRATLQSQGQVILLLNRRGFSSSIQCKACGFVVACPDCDLPLTHHHDGSKAVCHYCDYTIPTPPACPQCKHDGVRYQGLGTQKLEMEVKQRFPQARIARMDSDTMRKPGSHERILSEFRKGHLQILLGTQMIAKGLDFPNVLTVGIINADMALHFPDFRASEKTFQLITQVAGRTGRGERAGTVYLQTFSPEHPAIQAASRHDFLGFAVPELEHREKFGYPPFGAIARLIIRGPDAAETEAYAQGVGKSLQRIKEQWAEDCRILGPAPPPIGKLRGKYRFHILVQSDQPRVVNGLLSRAIVELKPPKEIQYVIDIDPIDML